MKREVKDSTEEFESRCLRFRSCSSICWRMVKKSSLEGASWERISGPVTGKPSVKRDSRPGLVFGVEGIGVDVEDAREDIVWMSAVMLSRWC